MIARIRARLAAVRAHRDEPPYTDGELADMRRTVWRLIRGVRR